MIKPDEFGDFVKANELLKKQIEKQYDGKNLHKNFFNCFVTPQSGSFYRAVRNADFLIHSP